MYVFTKKYIYIYIYHHLQTLEVWLHVVLFKCLTPHLLDIFHHFHFSFTCHHSLCHLWGFRCFFGENPTSSALPKSLGGHSSKSLPSVRKPAKEKKHQALENCNTPLKKKMIFLIIHVKFPGWTKDKNQKFQRFMSPLKHHKRPCENKTDHFEPLSW